MINVIVITCFFSPSTWLFSNRRDNTASIRKIIAYVFVSCFLFFFFFYRFFQLKNSIRASFRNWNKLKTLKQQLLLMLPRRAARRPGFSLRNRWKFTRVGNNNVKSSEYTKVPRQNNLMQINSKIPKIPLPTFTHVHVIIFFFFVIIVIFFFLTFITIVTLTLRVTHLLVTVNLIRYHCDF